MNPFSVFLLFFLVIIFFVAVCAIGGQVILGKRFGKGIKGLFNNNPCETTREYCEYDELQVISETPVDTPSYAVNLIARLTKVVDDVIALPPGLEKVDLLYHNQIPQPIALVALYKDTMYIVFRGTKRIEEWWSDLQTSQTRFYKFMVHSGFYNIYSRISTKILSLVSQISPKKIVVAGHSMGSALAVLTAVGLVLENSIDGNSITLYSFGGPRVGNQEFADFVDATLPSYFRITNKADVVPQVPFAVSPNYRNPTNPWIYAHAGEEKVFNVNTGSLKWNHRVPVYANYVVSSLK